MYSDVLILSVAALLLLVWLWLMERGTKLKQQKQERRTVLTEHNSWNLPAVDESGQHSLVILNHHFNYADMVPAYAGTPANDEALRRGYAFTLKGFEGKVFVKLRKAKEAISQDSVEFRRSAPRYGVVMVEYTYAYVREEVNK